MSVIFLVLHSLTISSTDYDGENQYELVVGIYESGDQYYNVELWTENNKRGYYRVISVNASDGNGQLSVAYLEGDDDYTLLEGEQTQIYFGSISGVNQFKMLKDVSLTNPLTDAQNYDIAKYNSKSQKWENNKDIFDFFSSSIVKNAFISLSSFFLDWWMLTAHLYNFYEWKLVSIIILL